MRIKPYFAVPGLAVLTLVTLMAQTSSFIPRASDDGLARGRAFVDRTEIKGAGTKNASLEISGNLPTPCHQLRVKLPDAPDASGALAGEVYSVSERGQICAQVLKPFTATVPLNNAQTLAKITVNGKAVGLPTQ